MKTWILLFCLLLASCGGRQAQFSDHEDFYWIDFRPLVKNEALEVGLNEWGTNPRYVQLETNEFIQIKFIQRVILDGDKFLVVHSDIIKKLCSVQLCQVCNYADKYGFCHLINL